MGKTERCVEIYFDPVGITTNGTRREVLVFLLKNSSNNKKKKKKNRKRNEKKQKPSREEWNGRAHYGKLYFELQAGQRYRIEETVIKNRRGVFRGWSILVVGKNREISVENWGGKFCPKFFQI